MEVRGISGGLDTRQCAEVIGMWFRILGGRLPRWCAPVLGGGTLYTRDVKKDDVEGGRGLAAQSISPRPLARAREIWVPTVSDNVAVSAPALVANAFASRRHSRRAAGPKPPVASTPKGEKSQPAAWHTALLKLH